MPKFQLNNTFPQVTIRL